jgi:ABC-type glycerol-3-phosphate transport system permease component
MTSGTKIQTAGAAPHRRLFLGLKARDLLVRALTTLILAAGAVIVLIPLLNMLSSSVKDKNQLREYPPRLIPTAPVTVELNGKLEPMYGVTIEGEEREMALIKNRPGGKGLFVDPANPEEVYELVIAEQVPLRHLEIHWENYPDALTAVPFGRYTLNTCIITFSTLFGILISCSLVAYGFSRFRAPGLNALFLVLLSTIMLPPQVTLIPLYVFFQRLGWVDTFLPLVVPAFFANAWDVFLLRQFFMSVPLEMDDAARIDGASSLQIFWHVMLPQARPALVATSVFHFLWAWNDFYQPLIYLHSQNRWTIAIGLSLFNALYSFNTHLIMAASVVMVLPSVILFFFSQRIFTQGVVISGIKG